jgi:hypothetical protein
MGGRDFGHLVVFVGGTMLGREREHNPVEVWGIPRKVDSVPC